MAEIGREVEDGVGGEDGVDLGGCARSQGLVLGDIQSLVLSSS